MWLWRMTIEQLIEVSLLMLPHILSRWDLTDLMVANPSYFSLLYSRVCICSLFNLLCSVKVEGWLRGRHVWKKSGFCLQLCLIQCDFEEIIAYLWFWRNHCISLFCFLLKGLMKICLPQRGIVRVNSLIPILKALWVSCSTELWNLPYYLSQHGDTFSTVISLGKALFWLDECSQVKQKPLAVLF